MSRPFRREPRIQSETMNLADLVSVDDIIIGSRASDIAGAASQILERSLPHHGFSPDEVSRLAAAVVARERELPTTCGDGAIPHARDAAITSFIAAIGTNRDGIVEGQTEPRVIFTFLSPASKSSEHLELLAALSRLAHETATMNAIAEAATAEDVVTLLKR
jgi:mannitol/fructose-specific phosphotransferase system IIA component (Ntr-type)